MDGFHKNMINSFLNVTEILGYSLDNYHVELQVLGGVMTLSIRNIFRAGADIKGILFC